MTLHWSTTGRPYAVCPNCGKLHTIMRRRNHLLQPRLHFRCAGCNTRWHPSADEQESLRQWQTNRETSPPPAGTAPDLEGKSAEETPKRRWHDWLL